MQLPHLPVDRHLPSIEPTEVAAWLMRHAFINHEGVPILVHRRGAFFLHNGQSWYEPSHQTIRTMIYASLAGAYVRVVKPRSTEHVPYFANKTKIDHVIDALEAAASVDEHLQLPAFSPPQAGDPTDCSSLLAFSNLTIDCALHPDVPPPTHGGTVIDLSSRSIPTTPRLLTLSGITVPYDPTATCPRWCQALDEWGNHDPSWSLSLERMLAYALLPTRRFAKWFLLEGQSRAGKGTVLSVLRWLVGPTAMFSTDFSQLSSHFGLDGIQHATILAIPEVSSGNTQQRDRISTILKLSLGEDPISIDVKYSRPLRNVMPAVVPILASNQIPVLANKSGGLSSKMVPIPFDVSFRGKEDHFLKDTLRSELPGIAARLAQHACALLGAAARREQPFTLTDRAKARLHLFHMTNNAAEAFLHARFTESPTSRVSYKVLRIYFDDWRTKNRIRLPHIPDNQFGLWLINNSTWSTLQTCEWRTGPNGDQRVFGLQGLALRPEAEDLIQSAAPTVGRSKEPSAA